VHGFFQGIFQFIVVIGFIRINLTPFWEIKLKGLEYTHITVWPWHQVAFDRLTVFGDQEMKFEPINIAFLAGNVSPIGFMLVYLSPWNPVMVTHSDGKVIKDIDRFSVELLPGVSSEIKQPHEKIRETVEPMVLTTAAEHVWHIPRRAQEGTRRFKIAAKEPHGHQARRDDFGITHLLWRVFGMAYRVQDLCTQAIHGQDLVVHGEPRLSGGKWVASTHPGG
jgi:hypothetical protein